MVSFLKTTSGDRLFFPEGRPDGGKQAVAGGACEARGSGSTLSLGVRIRRW